MAKEAQAEAEGYPFVENFGDSSEIPVWEREMEGKPGEKSGEKSCSGEEADLFGLRGSFAA